MYRRLVAGVIFVFCLSLFIGKISYCQDGGGKLMTHLVVCWLNDDAITKDLAMVLSETEKLSLIPGVTDFEVGTAIKSEREIVDDSFTFAISMKFKNVEEMQTYLASPEHVSYVNSILKPRLKKVVVYDF